MTTARPLDLARHDTPRLVRGRADYDARFQAIEARVGQYATESAQVRNDRRFSAEGISETLAPLRDATNNDVVAIVAVVEGWSTSDRDTINEILDGPEPAQSAETLAALAYRQQLALRKYAAADVTGIMRDLATAIEEGDAISAQVLADLLEATPVEPITTQNMATQIPLNEQRTKLVHAAIRLRADAVRANALELQDLLLQVVDPKCRVVRDTVGSRLSYIDQKADDRVRGSYSLDWPVPLGYQPGVMSARWSNAWGTSGLERLLNGVDLGVARIR